MAATAGTTARQAPSVSQSYELPIIHARVPESVGNLAFWAGLAGVVVAGAVDLPLAALIGAGVVVARHRQAS
jgi:hypothetical protein